MMVSKMDGGYSTVPIWQRSYNAYYVLAAAHFPFIETKAIDAVMTSAGSLV